MATETGQKKSSSVEELLKKIESLSLQLREKLKSTFENIEQIEALRIEWVGKKGILTEMMKLMGGLDSEAKPRVGSALQSLRNELLQFVDVQTQKLKIQQFESQIQSEKIDVSLPERRDWIPTFVGAQANPMSLVQDQLVAILERCGFLVEVGPEVEHEFYNFDALNIPPNHPSRALQDTFYIKGRGEKIVLRTHTSPVQIRTLLNSKPPIRMICPGRVYRSDYDATHSPMFHQIEGLLVDEKIHMGDLIGILTRLVSEFFGSDLKIRLRPSFFPFTEPSAEIDCECPFCAAKGCSTCKGSGWIEIGGSGMVDPEVFKAVGWDSEKFRGFAFGMGIERMAMIKFGVSDLRSFFESDSRFISQFSKWRNRNI